MYKKGMFVTFEGPDGSGKSSVSQSIYEMLIDSGYGVVYTREPGGVEIAEKIRKVILDPENTMMDRRTEALLYAAARSQHLKEKVNPAMMDCKIVLCDRFIDSSLAYQGYARGIGIEEIEKINMFATGNVWPDLTIFLDVPPEIGLRRIEGRDKKDRLDMETLDFHKKVYEGYKVVCERYPDRIKVVDATKPKDEVIRDAYELIKKEIEQ